jgi:hypothetical protein
MKAHVIEGGWTDAGTFESLFLANRIARNVELVRQGLTMEQIKKNDDMLME